MPGQYAKMESIKDKVFRWKRKGETSKEIAESFGLTKKQIKYLVSRENRKEREIKNRYVPCPQGRPRKGSEAEEIKRNNEPTQLRMQVDALRHFSKAGRR